jgi:transposase
MGRQLGQSEFWTLYRQEVVRRSLRDGMPRALIAERLGITIGILRDGIHRFKLSERGHA